MEIFANRDQWLAEYNAGWLAKVQSTGERDWSIYTRPINKVGVPGPGVDLSKSRVGLITSSGAYLPASQTPFITFGEDAFGDYTTRTFPTSSSFDDIDFAHGNYDETYVRQDPQVLLPLRHLEDLVAEGTIGELSPSVISFMGYQPDAVRVVDDLIPQIVAHAKQEEFDAALLVPA
jgi:hypothetical protein